MEALHHVFLHILKSALHGETVASAADPEVYAFAQTHKVLPLIYSAAPHPGLRQNVFHQTALQTMRTGDFLELYRHLINAGIQPLVVKGCICRKLYPTPDLRPSADEDLLIMPDQLEVCQKALNEFGMFVAKNGSGHEIPYCKQGSPLFVELHTSLFPPDSAAYGSLNHFFKDMWDRTVTVDVDGVPIRTLAPTDHLFYLICHAFKHFLHCGFGIRQVCDICLFAQVHAAEIHWDTVHQNCQTIRADRFTAALFTIGREHLGIPLSNPFTRIPVDEAPLLEDILLGGVYGSATESRLHSSTMTLSAAAGQPSAGLSRSLFPSAKQLQDRFPYLEEKPWLLPWAWGTRLIYYLHTKPDSRGTVATGNQRIALLRTYGIIERT